MKKNDNTLLLKAQNFYHAGNYKQAKLKLVKLLKMAPQNSEATHLLGVIHYIEGEPQKAITYISRAILINPVEPSFHINLGSAYQQANANDKARCSFEKAIALNPNSCDAHYNLGNLFLQQQQLEKATLSYQQVILLNPLHINALHNLGVILQKQNNLPAALNVYKQIRAINPNDPDCLNNMGIIYRQIERLDDAKAVLYEALQIKPNHEPSHNNLGNLYEDENDLTKAIFHYERAVQNNPLQGEQLGNLFLCLRKACQWGEIKHYENLLNEQTMRLLAHDQKPLESPFANITRCSDVKTNYLVAKYWSSEIEACAKVEVNYSFNKRNASKIKIGYLSYDFHEHPTAHLILGLFRFHDRNDFIVYVYDYGPNDNSYYRNIIKNTCDVFRELEHVPSAKIADIIYQDNIDILIDLKGFTKKHRLDICALRAAPIQINYLGFPGTSGASFFDYIITDKIVTPLEHRAFYNEKIIYMPYCYQINDDGQKIASLQKQRKDFCLPDNAFIFCCFNQAYKIDQEMFTIWLQCLQSIPNSCLWLLKDNQLAVDNLKNEANKYGILPERLIFAAKEDKADHLARLQLADLMLDTRIYNGHTTTSDALWAGLPVVTLEGNHFASRVSSSILQALGLGECITHSMTEYKELCIQLAGNNLKILALKEKIQQNKTQYPLFNTKLFVKNLEKAYNQIFQSYINNEDPRDLEPNILGE